MRSTCLSGLFTSEKSQSDTSLDKAHRQWHQPHQFKSSFALSTWIPILSSTISALIKAFSIIASSGRSIVPSTNTFCKNFVGFLIRSFVVESALVANRI